MIEIMKRRPVLIAILIVIFLLLRLASGKLLREETILGLLISGPFLYWWVVAYIAREDMVIPTAAIKIKSGEKPLLRLLFFSIGVVLMLFCANMG